MGNDDVGLLRGRGHGQELLVLVLRVVGASSTVADEHGRFLVHAIGLLLLSGGRVPLPCGLEASVGPLGPAEERLMVHDRHVLLLLAGCEAWRLHSRLVPLLLGSLIVVE